MRLLTYYTNFRIWRDIFKKVKNYKNLRNFKYPTRIIRG